MSHGIILSRQSIWVLGWPNSELLIRFYHHMKFQPDVIFRSGSSYQKVSKIVKKIYKKLSIFSIQFDSIWFHPMLFQYISFTVRSLRPTKFRGVRTWYWSMCSCCLHLSFDSIWFRLIPFNFVDYNELYSLIIDRSFRGEFESIR